VHRKRAGNLGHDTCMCYGEPGEKLVTKPCQERASEIISLPVIRERFIVAVRGGPAASHTSSSSSTLWDTLYDGENLSDRRPDRFAVSWKRSRISPTTLLLSRIDQLSEIYFPLLSSLSLFIVYLLQGEKHAYVEGIVTNLMIQVVEED